MVSGRVTLMVGVRVRIRAMVRGRARAWGLGVLGPPRRECTRKWRVGVGVSDRGLVTEPRFGCSRL